MMIICDHIDIAIKFGNEILHHNMPQTASKSDVRMRDINHLYDVGKLMNGISKEDGCL
jgi:hypothetical protein